MASRLLASFRTILAPDAADPLDIVGQAAGLGNIAIQDAPNSSRVGWPRLIGPKPASPPSASFGAYPVYFCAVSQQTQFNFLEHHTHQVDQRSVSLRPNSDKRISRMTFDRQRARELAQALLRARNMRDGSDILKNAAQVSTALGDGSYGEPVLRGMGFPSALQGTATGGKAGSQS